MAGPIRIHAGHIQITSFGHQSMKSTACCVFAILASVLTISPVVAQKSTRSLRSRKPSTKSPAKPQGLQAGDKVQLEWAGKTVTAEVTGRAATGWYTVKFDFNNITLTPTLPPNQLRPLGKAGTAAPAGTPAPAKTPPAAATPDAPAWSDVQVLKLSGGQPWTVRVEAEPASSGSLTEKPIVMDRSLVTFSSEFHSVVFSRAKSAAFAVVTVPIKQATAVQRLDLTKGKTDKPLMVPGGEVPTDVDDNGEWMVTRSDKRTTPGQSARVSLLKIGATKLEANHSWSPVPPAGSEFGQGVNEHFSPVLAKFVAPDRVLTVCYPANMTLWDTAKGKAIYTLDMGTNTVPALSPGRKLVAVIADNAVWLLDALTGRVRGKLPGDVGWNTRLSIRPDGKQLAAIGINRLQVWDLSSGELYRDINLRASTREQSVDWMADGYVLLGGQDLIDLDKQVVLWQYQHAGVSSGRAANTSGELGGAFWYGLTSKDGKAMGVFRTRLPGSDALKVAAGISDDDLMALRPGAKVSIKIDVQASAAELESIRSGLTATLKKSGFDVVPASGAVFTASTLKRR